MLDTAENVAGRCRISRDAQDAFALASQQRTAAAQRNGLFAAEIPPEWGRILVVTGSGCGGRRYLPEPPGRFTAWG